ncbi:GlcNAc-PI de-N-acetylase [Amycolatopsis xylanica]|uniref:GlcNAc-PI de-N-acetylase n=1 Tax=Amycolatopsis xylanica TaxID=589385 RepID=A0A1H2YV70_9PSEU|nr:PIG-L family deacetylase [Amycolatopsis xylanica]SDX09070.1 GlcNAc-PI de-N-acetylase [Amycolatopsis xylanica]
MTTTLSFIAHQDDDLLFMNPDIASDIQAGSEVWVVYLTAGDVGPPDAAHPNRKVWGADYADLRIQGVRDAYARAAKVANSWEYAPIWVDGRQIATNTLNGVNLRLVFLYIHAAEGADKGDLYRMLANPSFVANPIDGRPGYTKAQFQSMLHALIVRADPDFIRTQSTIGHRMRRPDNTVDHIDHTAAAILTANACVDANNNTLVRRDEYHCYCIQDWEDNVWGYWRDEKTAIWSKYLPHDPELGPSSWFEVMGKQYRPTDRIFEPGTPWTPPPDYVSYWA